MSDLACAVASLAAEQESRYLRYDFTGEVNIELAPPGTDHGYTKLTLTAGVIDWQARELLGCCHCHYLAGAVHALTGWNMIAFFAAGDPGPSPRHTAVLTPQGRVLDINGVHGTPQDCIRGSDLEARPFSTREANQLYDGHDEDDRFWWARGQTDVAVAVFAHYARLLVSMHQQDLAGNHRDPEED